MLYDPNENQRPPKHPFNVRIWNRLKKKTSGIF
jgi:hypothetical protein